MNPSTPSQRGEFDSSKTSHPWATACIQVPVLERKAPDQKSRKLRCRSARNIPPTLRLRSGSALISVDISILDTMSPAFSKAERGGGGLTLGDPASTCCLAIDATYRLSSTFRLQL